MIDESVVINMLNMHTVKTNDRLIKQIQMLQTLKKTSGWQVVQ